MKKQPGTAGTMEQHEEASGAHQAASGAPAVQRGGAVEEEMLPVRRK